MNTNSLVIMTTLKPPSLVIFSLFIPSSISVLIHKYRGKKVTSIPYVRTKNITVVDDEAL